MCRALRHPTHCLVVLCGLPLLWYRTLNGLPDRAHSAVRGAVTVQTTVALHCSRGLTAIP